MKILYVLESSHGGSARHVLDLAEGCLARNHQVHLVYSPLRMDGAFRSRMEAIRSPSFFSIPIPIPRNPGPGDLGALMAVRRYAAKLGPFDVVHGHSSKGGAIIRLACFGLAARRFYTPHAFITMNPGLGRAGRYLYGMAERALGFLAHGILTVSADEAEHARTLGISASKIFLVENGIRPMAPVDRTMVRQRFGIPPDCLVLGFIGRLVFQKDPDNLIDAFARLAPGHPDLRLVMVGEGPLEQPMRDKAAELGVAGRILWLGPVNGEEVLPAFDIFVLSSRYEGMPYVMIEALSAGKPIVATRVGGTGTIVIENRNGFSVPPGRPDLLADALMPLVEDEEQRIAFGKASLERAAHFSLDRMVDEILAAYEAVMRG